MMTTEEEKAKELFERFYNETNHLYLNGYSDDTAKQCALICVDEVLKELNANNWTCLTSVSYWQQVKQHIEKL